MLAIASAAYKRNIFCTISVRMKTDNFVLKAEESSMRGKLHLADISEPNCNSGICGSCTPCVSGVAVP